MRYFASDQHMEHGNLLTKLGRKGFATLEEHDEAVIEETNLRVGKLDTLFVLGDVAWKRPAVFRSRIKCRDVRFVIGNHDKVDACKHAFGHINTRLEVKLKNDVHTVLDHYPISYWNKCHYGAYHLYGHMHMQREATLNRLFPGRRSMDVGVDQAMRILGRPAPFSEDEIIELLGEQPGHDPVEFYRDHESMYRDFANLPNTGRFGMWKGRPYTEWLYA